MFDRLDIKSFRPISNLSFVSKLAVRLVVNTFNLHVNQHHLLPVHQSTYRPDHSTETAIAIVHNDIVRTTDNGEVSGLIFLEWFDELFPCSLVFVLYRMFQLFSANVRVYGETTGNKLPASSA